MELENVLSVTTQVQKDKYFPLSPIWRGARKGLLRGKGDLKGDGESGTHVI